MGNSFLFFVFLPQFCLKPSYFFHSFFFHSFLPTAHCFVSSKVTECNLGQFDIVAARRIKSMRARAHTYIQTHLYISSVFSSPSVKEHCCRIKPTLK